MLWCKVLGFLHHRWAYIEEQGELSFIHFFDDHKVISEGLAYTHRSMSIAGLIKNGFTPFYGETDKKYMPAPSTGLNFRLVPKRDLEMKYSKGKYWKEPDLCEVVFSG